MMNGNTDRRGYFNLPGRRLALWLGLLGCGASWGVFAAAPAPKPSTPANDIRRDAVVRAVQKVMPCVVNIATEEVVPVQDSLEQLFRQFFDPYWRQRPADRQYSLGSGVIIDEEGFVLTNFHVVNRARRVWVTLADGREYECDKLNGSSVSDVALLRIRAKRDDKFQAIAFAEDDDLLLGETVVALGNPFGLGLTVTRGILSSKSRRPPRANEPLDVPNWLQTDAAINPGNSGGPLVNLKGELIGVNVAIYREGEGIGFAIPIKLVAAAVADIYNPEWLAGAWFGAKVRPGRRPLRVLAVEPDSPAEQAGLREGDRLEALDGKPVRSYIDLVHRLADVKFDRAVRLQVQRGEQSRSVKLKLVPLEDYFNNKLVRRKLGLELELLSRRDLARMGLDGDGAFLITRVVLRTPAAEAGLDKGMLVLSVDGQLPESIVDLARLLYRKAKGEKVTLEVLWPRRRGPFVEYRRYTVELEVK